MYQAIRRLGDQNPILLGAWILGTTAVVLPLVMVPIRRSLGFRTNQYDKKPYRKQLVPNKIE